MQYQDGRHLFIQCHEPQVGLQRSCFQIVSVLFRIPSRGPVWMESTSSVGLVAFRKPKAGRMKYVLHLQYQSPINEYFRSQCRKLRIKRTKLNPQTHKKQQQKRWFVQVFFMGTQADFFKSIFWIHFYLWHLYRATFKRTCTTWW